MAKTKSSKKHEVKPEPAQETAEEEAVTVITPDVSFDHDDKNYYIDVELPGVDKEHIDLTLGEQSLCLEAARDETVTYLGCFTLAHAVNESQAKAKYDNGLLKIEVHLKAPMKGKKIQLE